MKSLRTNQQGIGHVVLLLTLVVVAGVGFAGWRVYSGTKTTGDTATVQSGASVPATLKTKADVTAAANQLDGTSVDSVNPDSLDSDLNSLL